MPPSIRGCGALGAALLITTLVVVPHTQQFARWAALPPAAPHAAPPAHAADHPVKLAYLRHLGSDDPAQVRAQLASLHLEWNDCILMAS